jgi:hypothetical protein
MAKIALSSFADFVLTETPEARLNHFKGDFILDHTVSKPSLLICAARPDQSSQRWIL